MPASPGPWVRKGENVANECGAVISRRPALMTDDEWEQIARLIAAAPRMLELLRYIAAEDGLSFDQRILHLHNARGRAKALLAELDSETVILGSGKGYK